jgi:GNAT superfamily N-acetyltransferase
VTTPRPRIPPEIKVELSTRQDGFVPRMAQIVNNVAVQARQDGDPTAWLQSVHNHLTGGEAMIVHARMGRTLVGFLVLDANKGAAPFSWVDHRYRNKGLGERFYSFACINLARTTPEFRFYKDMIEEYGGVIKSAGLSPTFKDSFYVVHDHAAENTANENAPVSSAPDIGKSGEGSGPRRLVIDDGQWVGFSNHDARRLKIRFGRLPRRVQD